MPLFRQQSVADARLAQRVIVGQLIRTGPLVQPLVQFGTLNILGRLKVVRRHIQLFRVKNFVDALFLQHRNRRRRRHIVTHDAIDFRIH